MPIMEIDRVSTSCTTIRGHGVALQCLRRLGSLVAHQLLWPSCCCALESASPSLLARQRIPRSFCPRDGQCATRRSSGARERSPAGRDLLSLRNGGGSRRGAGERWVADDAFACGVLLRGERRRMAAHKRSGARSIVLLLLG